MRYRKKKWMKQFNNGRIRKICYWLINMEMGERYLKPVYHVFIRSINRLPSLFQL